MRLSRFSRRENKNDFTRGSIVAKILRFMIPILGALVLQAMYGAVDILVVGWFVTTAGISGVSTGSNIVNLIIFTITGLSMGVTIVIGQYLGEKKSEKVGQVVGGAVCLFFVLACIIAYNVISSIFRGIGDSNMPLIFVGIACAVIARAAEYLKGFAPEAVVTAIFMSIQKDASTIFFNFSIFNVNFGTQF